MRWCSQTSRGRGCKSLCLLAVRLRASYSIVLSIRTTGWGVIRTSLQRARWDLNEVVCVKRRTFVTFWFFAFSHPTAALASLLNRKKGVQKKTRRPVRGGRIPSPASSLSLRREELRVVCRFLEEPLWLRSEETPPIPDMEPAANLPRPEECFCNRNNCLPMLLIFKFFNHGMSIHIHVAAHRLL